MLCQLETGNQRAVARPEFSCMGQLTRQLGNLRPQGRARGELMIYFYHFSKLWTCKAASLSKHLEAASFPASSECTMPPYNQSDLKDNFCPNTPTPNRHASWLRHSRQPAPPRLA